MKFPSVLFAYGLSTSVTADSGCVLGGYILLPLMSRKRLLLVGWDSADWKIMHPMIDAGHLPGVAGQPVL